MLCRSSISLYLSAFLFSLIDDLFIIELYYWPFTDPNVRETRSKSAIFSLVQYSFMFALF